MYLGDDDAEVSAKERESGFKPNPAGETLGDESDIGGNSKAEQRSLGIDEYSHEEETEVWDPRLFMSDDDEELESESGEESESEADEDTDSEKEVHPIYTRREVDRAKMGHAYPYDLREAKKYSKDKDPDDQSNRMHKTAVNNGTLWEPPRAIPVFELRNTVLNFSHQQARVHMYGGRKKMTLIYMIMMKMMWTFLAKGKNLTSTQMQKSQHWEII